MVLRTNGEADKVLEAKLDFKKEVELLADGPEKDLIMKLARRVSALEKKVLREDNTVE
ncbi:MAG: hypothetical protein MJA83_00475 [Gammaproteobacteria bacterium]|nr:hypothetical protein [Gammaproteobacteria bacterium]